MDGHEATLELRRMGVTCPIVGVTANVLNEDREAFMSKGLTDFLKKPVSREQMVQVLQRHGLCGCDPFRATDRTARLSNPKKQKMDDDDRSRATPGAGGG